MSPVSIADSVAARSDRALLQGAADRAELVEQLLAIGTALSSIRDLNELLHLILQKCREITWSDAGSVYLIDRSDEQPRLIFKVAQNDSQPNNSFHEFAMPIAQRSLAGYVALTGESLNLPDAYHLPPDVPYQFNHNFDSGFAYRTRSVLVLPMQNYEGEMIGVLQLINRKILPNVTIDPWNVVEVTRAYTDWEERIVRSLASQAAVSIERNQLQASIEDLFEGFVRASVQAIEARDPCTSGHSERVAALTVRLCEQMSETRSGRLGAVYFTPRQLQEIRYASLLHDFGKVGVPEPVLIKQKKLYPEQLEKIHYRFTLAKRTLQMECAQLKFRYLIEHPSHRAESDRPNCPHCEQLQQLDQELDSSLAQIERYWTVLLAANEPRVLAEEPLAQLQELAAFTYRDGDGKWQPLVTAAELDQLLVRRGNLTDLERQFIQSHVSHTFAFLERIPWTSALRNVPAIAYGHHEKLDGTGYPQGLRGDEIPLQSQAMAIADIYDALTAGDRPYKKALPPTAALTILHQEAESGKINLDCVQLFEQQQIFSILGHTLD